MLVRLAREAVVRYLEKSVVVDPPDLIDARAGVFVTLNYLSHMKEEHLRGCIGFPLPIKQLPQAVIDAAIAAATEDPRFPPVTANELPSLSFEVSILTPPVELARSSRYRDQITIGRDGLILKCTYGSGLLLPQVPVELNWDVEEYLANICFKAGVHLDALDDPASKLYSFRAEIFKEASPGGAVLRVAF
jgi:uncharacterized protein (TIGR00296 family)